MGSIHYIFARDLETASYDSQPRPFYWTTRNRENPLSFPLAQRWAPIDVVNALSRGESVVTVYLDAFGRLQLGEHVVGAHGNDGLYVRTKNNETKLDNLSNLPTKADFALEFTKTRGPRYGT